MIFEDDNQTRDFVHLSDVVQANLLALERDETNYEAANVGTEIPTSVKEIARMLAKGLGKEIEPEIVGKYQVHLIDITKAGKLLGYEPKIKLEEGSSELLEWIKNQRPRDCIVVATIELITRILVK